MNESLKTFVCKSEYITCTPIKAKVKLKKDHDDKLAEEDINFSWIIEAIGHKDVFIIHFNEFEFKDDTCEITYDRKTNSINIFPTDCKNNEGILSATIFDIGKEK